MPIYAADFDRRSRSPRWHQHDHQRAVGMRPTSAERAAGSVEKTAVEPAVPAGVAGIRCSWAFRWLVLLLTVRTGLQCMWRVLACTLDGLLIRMCVT